MHGAMRATVRQRALHRQRDIVVGGEIGEDAGDLERVGDAAPDPLVRRHVGDVAAVEDDAAGGGLDAAADQADEGRLAGAVGSDDGADLARHDGEVDAVHRLQPAIKAAEPARGEQRRHGSHLAKRSRIVPRMPFGK